MTRLLGSLRELGFADVPAGELFEDGCSVVSDLACGSLELLPQVVIHGDGALRRLPLGRWHRETVSADCALPQRGRVDGVSLGCGHTGDVISREYSSTSPCTVIALSLKWSLQHGTPPPAPGSNRDGVRTNRDLGVPAVFNSVLVATAERSSDIHDLLPLGCDTCSPRVAAWQIEFDRINKGDIEEIRWHVCDGCLPSCLHAATVQNQGITPPLVSEIPAVAMSAVA